MRPCVLHGRNASRDRVDGCVLHKHGSCCQSGLAKEALTLALSGGLLLLFGLVERATAAEGIFWEASASKSTFFATYFNHSNAGAFINLTLPLVAGRAILAFQNKGGQFERAFWSFLLLVSITAVFVNTSRASMVIGTMIIAALIIAGTMVAVRRRAQSIRTCDGIREHRARAGKRVWRQHDEGAYSQRFVREERLPRPRVLATAGVVLVCGLILILSFGIERSLVRWNQTLNSLFVSEGGALWEGRVSIYRICWLSLHAASWFGFGPGTFSIVFPFLQQEHGGELNGILRYAHQDYLQTILEWGALGFLLWAVLIGGGIVRVILYLWKDSSALTREQVMWLALCALSLIGVLIHSLVDFPLQIASLQLISAVLLGQLWAKLHDKRQLPRTPHVGMHAPLQGDCRN
jgi:O-antigen ligase